MKKQAKTKAAPHYLVNVALIGPKGSVERQMYQFQTLKDAIGFANETQELNTECVIGKSSAFTDKEKKMLNQGWSSKKTRTTKNKKKARKK